MKKAIIPFIIACCVLSCRSNQDIIAEQNFSDSIFKNFDLSAAQRINEADILFWKKRIDSSQAGYLNELKYAGTLISRFHLQGDIGDLRTADSIMQYLNTANNQKEAGVFRTLASLAILQHRFSQANDYVQKAISIGSEKYASLELQYDIAFELGNYSLSESTLSLLKSTNQYGYFFRLARQFHFKGEHDSSISAMQQALALAGSNKSLQQATLSNEGDLYLHASKPAEAYDAYKKSLLADPSDLHSLSGIGWIALMHDHNDSLAEKIFRFVNSHTKSPEQLLKLAYVAEKRSDTLESKKYALEFVKKAGDTVYGNMYNKYLIDLYTGLLLQPQKAMEIAKKELTVRKTPQTFSWFAWSLYINNERDSAYKVYQRYVSGRSLEGPELFYMGMMMRGMNKTFNAKQYLKAAYNNRFDLTPFKLAMIKKAEDGW
jgi:Tfp pilus assembly protein PilF